MEKENICKLYVANNLCGPELIILWAHIISAKYKVIWLNQI